MKIIEHKKNRRFFHFLVVISFLILAMKTGITVQATSLSTNNENTVSITKKKMSLSPDEEDKSTVSPSASTSPSPSISPSPSSSTSSVVPTVPKKFRLSSRKKTLVIGKSTTLKVKNLPRFYTVSFQSSNTKVASVNQRGKIRGKSKGTATITVTIRRSGKRLSKLTCKVTVGLPAFYITITKNNYELEINQKTYLNTIIKPSNSAEKPKYKSSNKKVVKVDSDGLLECVGKGSAIITASISNGKKDTCIVTVSSK